MNYLALLPLALYAIFIVSANEPVPLDLNCTACNDTSYLFCCHLCVPIYCKEGTPQTCIECMGRCDQLREMKNNDISKRHTAKPQCANKCRDSTSKWIRNKEVHKMACKRWCLTEDQTASPMFR